MPETKEVEHLAKGKEEKTFVVDDQAKITKATESLAFADLKPWMGVEMEYKQEKGKMTSTVIKVSAPNSYLKENKKSQILRVTNEEIAFELGIAVNAVIDIR